MSKNFRPEFVMVENKKFFLDENDAHNLAVFGSLYKKYYIECMLKQVKKGDITLSLGANIGYFTIFHKIIHFVFIFIYKNHENICKSKEMYLKNNKISKNTINIF